MTAVDRAAEIITDVLIGPTRPGPVQAAQALADAGLLLTEEAQAVLDAASRLVESDFSYPEGEWSSFIDITATYLASRGVS